MHKNWRRGLPLGLAASISFWVSANNFSQEESTSPGKNSGYGEMLLAEHGCVHCHKVPHHVAQRLQPKSAPDLSTVASRITPQYLRAFLADPQGTRPGTTMPDALHQLEGKHREQTINDLVHFLSSLGEPTAQAASPYRPGDIELGERLYHTVGCVACHTPQAEASKFNTEIFEWQGDPFADDDEESEPAVVEQANPVWERERLSLDHLSAKTNLSEMTRFLMDPLKIRPSGRMPSLGLNESEARAIGAYLLRSQLENPEAPGFHYAEGLWYEYFEEDLRDADPEFAGHEAKHSGSIPTVELQPRDRNDFFGFRLSGEFVVPHDGEYVFSTKSDDGSWLWINGELVVDNGGVHGVKEVRAKKFLQAGWHSLMITFFEATGGEVLTAELEGPGLPRQQFTTDMLRHRVPVMRPSLHEEFVIDLKRADNGKAAFEVFGCSSCHSLEGIRRQSAPPLSKLKRSPSDCLSETPDHEQPRYSFSDRERLALQTSLTRLEDLAVPREPAQALVQSMNQLGCYQCHARHGHGGPDDAIRDYFVIEGFGELGDEGRIPPDLSHTGFKFRRQALYKVLTMGDSVRPYMATRMPQFGKDNVASLVDWFAEVDSRPDDRVEPRFVAEHAEIGREIVGSNGFACVNCHGVGGRPSLGIPAVDLSKVYDRVKPAWFYELLWNPAALNMNTRMPAFWWEGSESFPELLDGDGPAQIRAVWAYLSLGNSMRPPAGLDIPDDAYDLVVGDEPLIFGTFMEGVSPRTIAVGFPEQTHYAFDGHHVRLAKAWRGEFMNARGTWQGRAGKLEQPAGTEILDFPKGGPLARLNAPNAAWPLKFGRKGGYQMKGYRLDADGRPVFRYKYLETYIEESIHPVLRSGGSWLRRRFEFLSPLGALDMHIRLGIGKDIQINPHTEQVQIDGRQQIRLVEKYRKEVQFVVREVAKERKEVLLKVPLARSFEVQAVEMELDW